MSDFQSKSTHKSLWILQIQKSVIFTFSPLFWCVFAAPMYYKGYYHLFYQYNPEAPVWGNLTWGHAVSKDLVHWLYLEDAMKPDQWYDVNGVWSGSATIDPDGIPFILYTGLLIASTSVSRISASLAQQWTIIDNDIFHFEQATLDFKDL